MAAHLGIPESTARAAVRAALDHQAAFERAYREEGRSALARLEGPIVILVGRPYIAYTSTVNLSLPRKIASRGFHVVPADLLPFDPPANEHNVWHFTQVTLSALRYARQHKDAFICCLSCFSCNPDAIIHHRIRHELDGRPFCFLEIDSHTADAGIDTRIGAFLDIIEARPDRLSPAGRISTGKIPRFDDPRVTHVLLADTAALTSQLFVALFGRMGWKAVTTPFTNARILQAARKVCSGRECLPFLSMVFVAMMLVYIFPTLVTWLPDLMYNR